MSIADRLDYAIDRAVEAGFSSLQIFTHSPQLWKAAELTPQVIQDFNTKRQSLLDGIIAVHAPYLINLAAVDELLWQKSIRALALDLKASDELGADIYVIHPGSSKENREIALQRVADGFPEAIKLYQPHLKIAVENTSGSGSCLGASISELNTICELAAKNSTVEFGFCFDTAHAFGAGIDFQNVWQLDLLMQELADASHKILMVHCNDSESDLDSRKDRHANIGEGKIGLQGFKNLAKLAPFDNISWVLETPKGDGVASDIKNRETIQKILSE